MNTAKRNNTHKITHVNIITHRIYANIVNTKLTGENIGK